MKISKKLELILGNPAVDEQKWMGMQYSSFHLRVPVTAKGGTVNNVKAEIAGGSKEIIPKTHRVLFWLGEFLTHERPEEKKTPEYMAEHMKIHYKGAHQIVLYEGKTR